MTDHPTVDFDRRLDLAGAARAFDVPDGDVAAVLRRAHRRTTRRHRALAVLSVAAVVAAGSVSVELLDGEDTTTVASGGVLVRGDVGVTWRPVTPGSGLGFATDAGSTAPLYALSTAPGLADVNGPGERRVVWRSDDGVEWTSIGAVGGDLFASDLSARDERVYAVGTGPASAAAGGRPVSPLLVGWSDDGARTWQRVRLPVDLDAIAARTTRSIVRSTAVAAGPAGTVVAGVLDASPDVNLLLPAGVAAPDGWAQSASGIDLLGPEREGVCPEGSSPPAEAEREPPDPTGSVHPVWCTTGDDRQPLVVSPQDARGVIASYTWEQLGVEGDLLRAVRRRPVAFFAPAGSDRFERVDLPALDEANGPVLLDASDAGFDLVITTAERPGRPSVVALASPDGRTWTASGVVRASWAAAAGRVGGVATVVAQGERGAVVVRADGAGGWVTTSLDDVVGAGPEAQVSLMSAAVGPFGVVAALAPVAPKGSREGGTPAHVVVSRDGRTWDDVTVEELAGRPVGDVVRTGVVGERAVVAVSVPAEAGGRPRQLVLVGTPS